MLTTVSTLSRSPIADLTPLGIFADYTYNRLRTISVGGKVDAYVTTPTNPYGIISAGSNIYYYSEPTRHVISRVNADKSIIRYVGVAYTPGAGQGSYPNGQLCNPQWMVKDTAGNLYVTCNYGNGTLGDPGFVSYATYIAKISTSAVISRYTFLPVFFPGYTNPRNNTYKDWVDGNVSGAVFGTINSLCIDQNDNIYLLDRCAQPSANYNSELRVGIRKISSAGVVTTVEFADWIGGNFGGYYGGLTCAPDGTLYYSKIVDPAPAQNGGYLATSRIYRRATNGTVTQIAGSGLLLNNETFLQPNPLDHRAATDSLIGLNANFCFADGFVSYRCPVVNSTKTILYLMEPNQVLRTIGLSGNFPVSKLAGSYSETAFKDGTASGASWDKAGQFLLF